MHSNAHPRRPWRGDDSSGSISHGPLARRARYGWLMRDEGRTEEQRRVDGLLQTEKIMIWMEGTSASGEEDGVDVKLSGWMDYLRRTDFFNNSSHLQRNGKEQFPLN